MSHVASVEDEEEEGEEDFEFPPGLTDEDVPGFPAEGFCGELPDLSEHCSIMSEVLRQHPAIYTKLRGRRTALGVELGRCIKVGIDNIGHRLVKTTGIVAGDEECYETFRELFDLVMQHTKGRAPLPGRSCPMDLDRAGSRLRASPIDSSGKYVLSSQVRAWRNLRGFPFPPAMTLEDRLKVGNYLQQAFSELQGLPAGEYVVLSEATQLQEASLQAAGLLPEPSDSPLALATGAFRHWPHGRGVFLSSDSSINAWINEQEHLRVTVALPGDGVQGAFRRLVRLLDAVAGKLRRAGVGGGEVYANSERLGFLTSSPLTVGAAMQVSMTVRLPHLMKLDQAHMQAKARPSQLSRRHSGVTAKTAWRNWCKDRGAQIHEACDAGGRELQDVYEVSSNPGSGLSPVDTVNLVIEAVEKLIQLERCLEAGREIDALLADDTDVQGVSAGSSPSDPALREVAQRAARCLQLSVAARPLAPPADREGAGAAAAAEVPAGVSEAAAPEAAPAAFAAAFGGPRGSNDMGTTAKDIFARLVVGVEAPLEVPPARVQPQSITVEAPPEVWAKEEPTPSPRVQAEPPRKISPKMEELRGRLHDCLFDALETGQLEEAVADALQQRKGQPEVEAPAAGAAAAAPPPPPAPAFGLRPTAPPSPPPPAGGRRRPPSAKDKDSAGADQIAVQLLKKVSESDQRVGNLTAMINRTAALIAEREQSCAGVQESIAALKLDLAHLELDIEWYKSALASAEDRNGELEGGRRKLQDELEMKEKRVGLVDTEAYMTARSDLSTATGGASVSSMTLGAATRPVTAAGTTAPAGGETLHPARGVQVA